MLHDQTHHLICVCHFCFNKHARYVRGGLIRLSKPLSSVHSQALCNTHPRKPSNINSFRLCVTEAMSSPRLASTPACAIKACTMKLVTMFSIWKLTMGKPVRTPNLSCMCCKNAATLKTHASLSNAGILGLVRSAYATRMPDRHNLLCGTREMLAYVS